MTSAIFIFLSKIAFTASITIGGGSFANVLNGLGDALPEGSQIQVGSFDGVEPSKSGADFTSVDWQSFNPFLGIGSTNPDEVIGTFSAGEGLESVFQISSELDAELGDLFPSEFPVRLGLRIFDTTANSLEGVAYNTVVRDVSTWVFNDPEVITNQPPTPSIATEDDSLMFWEDNENPFQTSITTTDDSTRIEELEAQLASVIAERDARPTQEDYDALIAERDENLENYTENLAEKGGVITTLSESITEKDAAYALVVAERDENLENYTENLAEKDGVITTLSESITEKDAAYALVVAERDSRFEDTDADGITDIKEIELETDPNVGTVFYLNNTEFETAVASARETGQNDVIIDPLSFGLVLGSTYEAVIAERDARFIDTDKDGLTDLKEAELESDNNELTPFYLQDAYELGVESARFEGRTDVTNNPNAYSLVTNAQYNFVVAERDGRPTQEDLAEVIAERDARPTLGEVKDARLGSVVLQSDNANNSVKIRFSIEETDDFKVWTKRDGVNEVTVPLEAGSKFYRFALQDE
ncbi:HlyD family secretion protein [Akkermansiaceae bacterium]|nr:HlyD family secretion protein [Akkermansiaceae bacterium]